MSISMSCGRLQCSSRALEVHVLQNIGHALTIFARRLPRSLLAGVALVTILVGLIAAHSVLSHMPTASTATAPVFSSSSEASTLEQANSESPSICHKDCLTDAPDSSLILIVCSVILAIVGFVFWALRHARLPGYAQRTSFPNLLSRQQLTLFPRVFTPDRLKLSISRT